MNRSKVIVLVLIGLFVIAPTAVFASGESGSPGTTSTFMYMPVIQKVTGLTANTAYDVVLYSPGTNVTVVDAATADADGELSFTVDEYNDYGVNSYVVQLDAGWSATSYYIFTINNQDIIPFLIPLVLLGILFSVFRSLKRF